MHVAHENQNPKVVDDHRGRMVIVATHVISDHIEQFRADLRPFLSEIEGGRFKVNGFVLGRVVDVSVHGHYWVDFDWLDSPIQINHSNVLRLLLDDEGEPEVYNGLPRLVP